MEYHHTGTNQDKVSLIICAIIAGFCGASLCFALLVVFGASFDNTAATGYDGFFKIIYDWQSLIGGMLAFIAAILVAGLAYRQFSDQRKSARAKARTEALIGLYEAVKYCSIMFERFDNIYRVTIQSNGIPLAYSVDKSRFPEREQNSIERITPLLEFETNQSTRDEIEALVQSLLTANHVIDEIKFRPYFETEQVESIVVNCATVFALGKSLINELEMKPEDRVTEDRIWEFAPEAGIHNGSNVNSVLRNALTRK